MLEFVKAQPDYNEKLYDDLLVIYIQKVGCMIIYGKDERYGIAGIGVTPDLAFNEFAKRWKQLKGFQWLDKNRWL